MSAAQHEAFQRHLTVSEGINVTAHIDGCCIRYGGDVVEVFPTSDAAWLGAFAAEDALVMLAETLRRKP